MSDILFETVGRAGLVTLNRPKALNSLTEAMMAELGEALDEWARDDRIARVAIRSEGKAFCAGGDLRDVHARRAGAIDFFATEYRTNHRIATFPKAYVALIQGVCMGGGVGLSAHGDYRVATDSLVFAMPEAGIGLFPDVGATHLLSRMDGGAGLWLVLTGERLDRDDAAAVGFVTHPVEGSGLEEALDRTAHARDLDAALGDLSTETRPFETQKTRLIADAFSAQGVEEILDRFDAAEDDAAASMAAQIRTRSPTSLKIAYEQMGRARTIDPGEVLKMDFRIVSRILDGHDLYEGIRAVVIDKDQEPRWDPATLEAVDRAEIEAHFGPSPHGDLDLAQHAATDGS